jgi:hypothetical protein
MSERECAVCPRTSEDSAIPLSARDYIDLIEQHHALFAEQKARIRELEGVAELLAGQLATNVLGSATWSRERWIAWAIEHQKARRALEGSEPQ